MIRVTRGTVARHRRKKILKLATGYFGSRHRLFRVAKESVHRALAYSYRDRRVRKRFFRRLWIMRINAFARLQGSTYSKFISKLRKDNCIINRKILSFLCTDEKSFSKSLLKAAI
jgi:large subunit ribosomal protein L20